MSQSFSFFVAEAWAMGGAVAIDAMTVTIAAQSAYVAAARTCLEYLLTGKDRLLIVSGPSYYLTVDS